MHRCCPICKCSADLESIVSDVVLQRGMQTLLEEVQIVQQLRAMGEVLRKFHAEGTKREVIDVDSE
jgi:hypothetical protein